MNIKCKHCCKDIFHGKTVELLNAHNRVKQNRSDTQCTLDEPESCSYISEENMPEWIERVINIESWTKGRLHCPHCNNRIGSFNFVQKVKCSCGEYLAPPIKLINSKVDILFYEN